MFPIDIRLSGRCSAILAWTGRMASERSKATFGSRISDVDRLVPLAVRRLIYIG